MNLLFASVCRNVKNYRLKFPSDPNFVTHQQPGSALRYVQPLLSLRLYIMPECGYRGGHNFKNVIDGVGCSTLVGNYENGPL